MCVNYVRSSVASETWNISSPRRNEGKISKSLVENCIRIIRITDSPPISMQFREKPSQPCRSRNVLNVETKLSLVISNESRGGRKVKILEGKFEHVAKFK